jgi:XTP/dITP diphosphohydrolase
MDTPSFIQKVVFATGNKGKMREVKEILEDTGWDILSMKEAGIIEEAEENGNSFEENAMLKARCAAAQVEKGVMVLADDSGLEIDALNKEPGIYSARYLGEKTSFSEKCQHLLKRLEKTPLQERKARFVCVVAAILPNGEEKSWRGVVEGNISLEMKGDLGFGYDPIFQLPENNKTMAELPEEIKNTISHRGLALKLMKAELFGQED